MKGILVVSSLALLVACNNESEVKPVVPEPTGAGKKQDGSSGMLYNFTDSALQKKISDTLMQLPFVIESNKYIDSISGHSKALSFITDTTGKNISVMAGYNGPERFETYYHFNIQPGSFAISVLDNSTGNFIPVADYLKKNKDTDQ